MLLCSRIILSRKLMHYAASTCCMPLYRESLVVAAEGLLKRGGVKCVVHADGLCTRIIMSTYCRKKPGTCFPSCIWPSQREGARVPNRIKTVICVRRLCTYVSCPLLSWCFHRQIEASTCGIVACPSRCKTYTAVRAQ